MADSVPLLGPSLGERLVSGFLKPHLLPIALGATALACAGTGWLGWHLGDLRLQAYKGTVAQEKLKAKDRVVSVERTSADISHDARDKGDTQQAATRTLYKTITEKVYTLSLIHI